MEIAKDELFVISFFLLLVRKMTYAFWKKLSLVTSEYWKGSRSIELLVISVDKEGQEVKGKSRIV